MMINFETHIVLKLIKEYREARNRKVLFDLDKSRNLGRPGDKEANQDWHEMDMEDKINRLVTKGLVEEQKVGGGKYQTSDLGIEDCRSSNTLIKC
jgi:hypothetical protein